MCWLTFHPLQEKAPPTPTSGQVLCYISHFNQTNPETIGWFRSLCSCEPGSVGNGWDGDTRGPKNPRNCESGVAVGSATCWAPRAGALAPTVPRLSQRPGTRDSFHCCTSAVAMLEGEPLDLGSLPSAGGLQPPAWGSPGGASYLCSPRLSCETRRVLYSATRGPCSAAPASPHPRQPAAQLLRADRSPLRLPAAGVGPGSPGQRGGRRGAWTSLERRTSSRPRACAGPTVRQPRARQ